MTGISVIICCYNSALRIPLTLEYLAKQKTFKNRLNWEIIVVNNNSTDNTATVSKNIWNYFAGVVPLYVIDEFRPGLNNARETGVKAANYDIIIFCDDDNLLEENYLQYAVELVSKTKNSGYAIWGGKPDAYFDNDTLVPEWFEKEKLNYVVGEQASEAGDICSRGYVWGAGMVMLKEVFSKIINENLPLLLTDRAGVALSSGGDSEISLRALIAGYKLYYDPNLTLQHYIPAQKLTLSYNAALQNGLFMSNEILNKYKIFIFYVSGKNKTRLYFYAFTYKLKYYLSKLNIRRLTAYDVDVLKALGNSKKFYDEDFNVMYSLLGIGNRNIS